MPTIKQQRAFTGYIENFKADKPLPLKRVFKIAGYSDQKVRHPKDIIKTVGFQELLAQVPRNDILQRVIETAMDRTDKRAHLAAADMVFKLTDSYPADKLKSISVIEQRSRVSSDTNDSQPD